MAVNPSIPLSVNPPQPIDIAGAFQKAANLRNMANQETIQKQAIEQNAQAIRDQQLVRKAWIEANGKDEDFLTRIKTAGVSPDTFQRYEAAYQERRGRMAATNADELKAQQLRWGNLRSLFLTVLDEKDETKSKALMDRSFEIAKAQKLITDEELKRIQSIMDKGWNREDAQMYINSLSSEINLSEEVLKPVEVQPGNTLVDPNTGKPIFTAPANVTEPTGDYREFLQTYYPGWLESNGKTKSATNEMKAWQDFVKDKRTSKLLTPEEEAQEIRIRQASKSPEKTSEDEDYEYWKTLTRDANRQLAEENKQRISEGGKPANEPSGSEIARLRNTPEGPGTRRWGGGQKMPKWLAEQYFEQANGNKDEAKRMALTDGWDIRK